MHRTVVAIAGVALIAGLAGLGEWARARAGLAVPGAVLGLMTYLLLLASGRFGWSLAGADLLTGLIGAMIVPALVGLALFADVLGPALGGLAVVLVASTCVTALAAALLFRLAGGRG